MAHPAEVVNRHIGRDGLAVMEFVGNPMREIHPPTRG
jgi:hypothetical protein